uniref:Uncharacterized protein n=1 Tax=Oryza glumipatula TaxID=40148 RepID=A0A0D9ZUS3_9ORYZ
MQCPSPRPPHPIRPQLCHASSTVSGNSVVNNGVHGAFLLRRRRTPPSPSSSSSPPRRRRPPSPPMPRRHGGRGGEAGVHVHDSGEDELRVAGADVGRRQRRVRGRVPERGVRRAVAGRRGVGGARAVRRRHVPRRRAVRVRRLLPLPPSRRPRRVGAGVGAGVRAWRRRRGEAVHLLLRLAAARRRLVRPQPLPQGVAGHGGAPDEHLRFTSRLG